MAQLISRHLNAWRTAILGLGGGVASGAALTVGSTALSSPWMLLGIPVATSLLVVLMLSPSIAFLCTAFIVPVERLGRFTNDNAMLTISLMRIVGSIALLSLVTNALLLKKRLHFGAAFWVYTLYFCLAITGVFHTTHKLGTVRHIGAILGNLLFFFIVINLGRSHELARKAVGVWLFATTLAGIYTIITWHFGSNVNDVELTETSARFSTVLSDSSEWEALDVVARATGPTSHSAVYGINLITSIPLFFYFLKFQRGWVWKTVIAAAIAIVFYNVLLTNTRAVMLVAAITVGLCAWRGLYRITAKGLVAALLVGAAMLPLVPSAIWDRVLDSKNYSTQTSATLRVRFDYWTAGLQIIRENWLTGIGVGNQVELPKYLNFTGAEETTAHNEYIFTAMEVGIFGWMLFFGFVGMVFAAAWKAQHLLRRLRTPCGLNADFFAAIQISMIATLIFGVQVDVFHFPLKGWWLLAGLAWAQYSVLNALAEQSGLAATTSAAVPGPSQPSSGVPTHAR